VFRGTAGIGISIEATFLGKNLDTLPKPEPGCYFRHPIKCNTHYRSPLLDNWQNLNIKQVYVSIECKIYTDETELCPIYSLNVFDMTIQLLT